MHDEQDLVPHQVVDRHLVSLNVKIDRIDVILALHRVLLHDLLKDQVVKSISESCDISPELLIDLVSQHLTEEEDFNILELVFLNGCDHRVDLVDHQTLEAILLVEVGVQELLHSLTVLLVSYLALFIMLFFQVVDVVYCFFDLLQRVIECFV